MNLKAEISDEIKGISTTLSTLEFKNVFSVEADYFATLPKIILAKIAANNVHTIEIDAVPADYFENLADNIFNKIRSEENEVSSELNKISPIIAGIENKETYKVDEGYFAQFSFINEDIKQPAKIVKMSRASGFFKYAAAAVITGLLGLGIINITDKNTITTIPQTASIKSNSANTALQFDEALLHVSDKEIEKYLQESGHDVSAALVASAADDAEKLPEPTDYLLDENALDNFIKENNLKN